jgi:hypothetical protein
MSYVSKIEIDASFYCKRYFKILNFFKIASGDNSVKELDERSLFRYFESSESKDEENKSS